MGAAVGEVSFPAHVVTASRSCPVRPAYTSARLTDAPGGCWGHAWDSATLTPFGPHPGRRSARTRSSWTPSWPAAPVSRSATTSPCRRPPRPGPAGSRAGGGASDKDGLASQSALFFSAAEAERLAGHPGRVDAIGVLAEPGVDTETLHERVAAALEDRRARPRRRGQRPGGVP